MADKLYFPLKRLDAFLNGACKVLDNGQIYEVKGLIGSDRGIQFKIFPDEHAPPHFHVDGKGIKASFKILDGELLTGRVSSRDRKIIDYWYSSHKDYLIKSWNVTRPDSCPVGKYNSNEIKK